MVFLNVIILTTANVTNNAAHICFGFSVIPFNSKAPAALSFSSKAAACLKLGARVESNFTPTKSGNNGVYFSTAFFNCSAVPNVHDRAGGSLCESINVLRAGL